MIKEYRGVDRGSEEGIDSSLWSDEFKASFFDVVLENIEHVSSFYRSSTSSFGIFRFIRVFENYHVSSDDYDLCFQITKSQFDESFKTLINSILYRVSWIVQTGNHAGDWFDVCTQYSDDGYLFLEFRDISMSDILKMCIARLESSIIEKEVKQVESSNNKKGVRL